MAIRRGLAGMFARGSDMRVEDETMARLQHSARREAFDAALHAERVGEVLAALEASGVRPLVLRGRALASSVWPDPAFRPTGDLDVLVDAASWPPRPRRSVHSATGHEVPSPSELGVTEHSHEYVRDDRAPVPLVVDLHTQLFRSVGSGIRAEDVLARATLGELDGHPVLQPDDADRLLIVFVHAAKHAVRQTKWLLDMIALAGATSPDVWDEAARRAVAAHATRPFYMATRLLASIPEVTAIPTFELMRPPDARRSFARSTDVARPGADRTTAHAT